MMMSETERTAMLLGDLLIKTDEETDHQLLDLLAQTSVSIRKAPATGLVMMIVTDGTGENFHLGEVLVTEAEAEYKGHIGYAMIVGNEPQKAILRASLSAIAISGDESRQADFCAWLTKSAEKIRVKEQQTEAKVASTTVHFEKMTQW